MNKCRFYTTSLAETIIHNMRGVVFSIERFDFDPNVPQINPKNNPMVLGTIIVQYAGI
jgi:hypothetical protein